MKVTLPSGSLNLHVEHSDIALADICGFACRQNPKRGFLFVSKVLGKHYPVKPSKMAYLYDVLAEKINKNLHHKDNCLFLGFAETATGLGSGVYDHFKSKNNNSSFFIHTTRYNFIGKQVLFNFQEEHSHATGHIVYQPEDKNFNLSNYNTLVLVDDEMTTGKTMSNFIEQFTKMPQCKVKKIVLVCIKNWMSAQSIQTIKENFPDFEIQFVQILKGQYSFTKDESFIGEPMPNVDGNNLDKTSLIAHNYGRFGVEKFENYNFSSVHEKIDMNKKTLVLGTGEFSYYPYLLAKNLEENGVPVVYQSTTRSPIMVGNDIAHKLTFLDNYQDDIVNFVYNVTPEKYEQVLIGYETKEQNAFSLDKDLKAHNIFFSQLDKNR